MWGKRSDHRANRSTGSTVTGRRGRVEEALRSSEARFRTFVDQAIDAFFLLDDQLHVVDVNKQASESLGYTREELIGMHPRDFDVGLEEATIELLRQRTAAGETLTFETRHRRRDGSDFPVEIRASQFEQGGGTYFLSLVRDISERKRAEEERTAHLWFLEAMDRVNRAMEGTQDLEKMISDVLEVVLATFACDRAWLHDCGYHVAPSARVIVELTRPEYPGPAALGIVDPLPAEIIANIAAVKKLGAAVTYGPGGRATLPPQVAERWSIRSQLLTIIEPKVDQLFVFGLHQCSGPRVWTEQEQRLFLEVGRRLGDALTSRLMLRSLRESERRLDEAQRIAHVGYWDRELDTGRMTLSDEACRIFGLSTNDRVLELGAWHERWSGLIHPQDRTRVAAATEVALQGGPAYDVEYRIIRPGGEVRIIHSRGEITRDASGQAQRIFGMMQDITELRRAEDELRSSEARFRTFVDHATDAVFVQDERLTILDVNRQACESLGYTREELIGMRPRDIDVCVDEAALDGLTERTIAGETPTFETYHRRKDGTVFPVEIRGRQFDQGGLRFLTTARDITDRKRSEQRLRAHYSVTRILAEAFSFEEAAPRILEAVSECLGWDVATVWRIDREGGVLRCAELWRNPRAAAPQFEAATRACRFELGRGLPGRVWSSRTHAFIADLLQQPDLSEVPIRGADALRDGLRSALAFPILLGSEVLGVLEFFAREAREPDQDLINMMATIGSQIGQFIERKRAESALQLARSELTHVMRVLTLGELTASIAHEVNQPLGAMVTSAAACARWLAAEPSDMRRARRALERIIRDGRRASAVIERIRALTRRQEPRKEHLDINDTVREVVALIQYELRRNGIVLEQRLAKAMPEVLGDKVQLQQVLLNLMINAIEAMSAVNDRSRNLTILSAVEGSNAVWVEVRDSGVGLDPEGAARLFEPFYTTKANGIGIGLSISHSIIEAHGGQLSAAPILPYGTALRFWLPRGGAES